MTDETTVPRVGPLPKTTAETPRLPIALTRVVWLLWAVSLVLAGARLSSDQSWSLFGLFSVDGLTVVMWVVATFFSGIVHSYSRRYMAGDSALNRFFGNVFAFTLVVMALVAADSLVVFAALWLAMGLVMANLIGHVDSWRHAHSAASHARRSFAGGSVLLAISFATLWWETGATTISGVATAEVTTSGTVLFAVAALLLAAMIQSALLPFHTWLLSSMTAPTPASALMHAGFVNAGGILLLRFAPVVTVDGVFMLAIVLVGATSALLGKLLKTVQTDVKSQLGCSTIGQMGFMFMQAGLGFFGAAITHLVLHGFYKAYQFLSSGSNVEQKAPGEKSDVAPSMGVSGVAVTALTALAGGVLFALVTGKGLAFDTGLLLAGLVVLTTMHAARETIRHTALPRALRYGGVPLVFLPAIAVYASVYNLIEHALVGVPLVTVPAELTPVHLAVAAAFVLAYITIESGVYRRSTRLYVTLANATRPTSGTIVTNREEYNEH
ncbi:MULTISPECIES: proton-conducting transporter membrane subunit [Haloferax]|uniref:Oxidoreductase n=1 Tax=Haloferax marinum TaxID=2666143 RepID=A0A6A8G6F1_9EURY|nr:MULTISPECIES: proton-conducting transporter membrane subunit [Haloferax]KAB1196832.1 oxidoreductase [Haloferax sp. CBA1150]MRW95843.1 oxidoreductase [Haloferax marinum]